MVKASYKSYISYMAKGYSLRMANNGLKYEDCPNES